MTDDYVGRSGSHRFHYRYRRATEERDRARDRCLWLDGKVAEAIRLLEGMPYPAHLEDVWVAVNRTLTVLKAVE